MSLGNYEDMWQHVIIFYHLDDMFICWKGTSCPIESGGFFYVYSKIGCDVSKCIHARYETLWQWVVRWISHDIYDVGDIVWCFETNVERLIMEKTLSIYF